jgi:hypothetical protein
MAPSLGTAVDRGNAARPRAVLRLWGVEDIPAATLLEAAGAVRRALEALGITEVSVEVAPAEDETRPPAPVLVS